MRKRGKQKPDGEETSQLFDRERLGELLVRADIVSAAQLADALEEQRRSGGKLGKVLVELGMVTEDRIAETLAWQKGLEHLDLSSVEIDRAAANLIPERLARRKGVIPIGIEGGRLLLAMSDPLDIETIDDVELRTGRPIVPMVATLTQVGQAVDRYLTSNDVFKEAPAEPQDPVGGDGDVSTGEDVPIVRLVNQIIREAVDLGASDVHIEPMDRVLRVRYRVDGVMHEVMELPSSAKPGVVSRIKIMAEMDIAERRLPQDGRLSIAYEGRRIDMRVATLATPAGENVVIRLLGDRLSPRSLEELGMNPEQLDSMRSFLAQPYGAVLLTGPTGSGKSTTLYAALKTLDLPSRKIITIEDPIEYRIPGVTQISVHPRIGLTFASGLRTILRSDPDIIMVGEIRDPETAEITIRAALTGHLVLSSLHTNDAPSSLTRLTDIGVPPFITSSALVGVVAQRLVRRLCEQCKRPSELPPAALVDAGFTEEEAADAHPFVPVGCPACSSTGYKGRMGLFEVMTIDDDLRREFLRQAPTERLRESALESGMRSLRRDALDKVAAGLTSLEEIERVVL